MRAFAKINLGLRVGPRRADGFHDVKTILQSIDLADRLVFEATRGPFELHCSPGVPIGRKNLVWRAAEMLWNAGGREGEPRGARVLLRKNIPMEAGLGGGSSDAAATFLALRKIWKLSVSDEQLVAIGARIGSDVPYFFVGGTALGLGRGEEVYPLAELPRWSVVLVFPPFGVSTSDAYGWLDEYRLRSQSSSAARFLPNSWLSAVPLVNDLEAPIAERHPVIGSTAERLRQLGAVCAAMSGSGSAVFGVFTSQPKATRAAKAFGKLGRTVVTRFRQRG
jgi:4-diphosphocytidyl-2-C-methyl-D-erythritol kinase